MDYSYYLKKDLKKKIDALSDLYKDAESVTPLDFFINICAFMTTELVGLHYDDPNIRLLHLDNPEINLKGHIIKADHERFRNAFEEFTEDVKQLHDKYADLLHELCNK